MKTLKGIGAVAKTAMGRIKTVATDLSDYFHGYSRETPEKEIAKLLAALAEADEQLSRMIQKAAGGGDSAQAAILEAHRTMLIDPALKATVLQKLDEGEGAPQAMLAVAEQYAAMLASLDEPYLRERAADVLDVGRRVARILLKVDRISTGSAGVILCAKEIEPSLLAEAGNETLQGIILGHGSTTSHAVIIAKAKGLVTIVGINDLSLLTEGLEVVLDGKNGEVIIEPSPEVRAFYQQQIGQETEQLAVQLSQVSEPAITQDGYRVQLAANIGVPGDMERAVEFGCEGVGLYRTEFLFMGRNLPPGEDEQAELYRQVVQQCGQSLCIIRTMDIGGDKPLAYLDIGQEDNPFLGWRAIRISLDRPELFVTQLKAILRAGVSGKVAIMLPMVISAEEIRKAKAFIAQAAQELEREGKAFSRNVPLGIMVETPAAAVLAPLLAKDCDFFSIGTNDLVQYTLAVDRGNARVSKLYSHYHPAILRLVDGVIRAAHENGIWAGMCGEMAGDPGAAMLLTAMGIDELSMSAASIPKVKSVIRGIDKLGAERLLQQVFEMDDAEKIKVFVQKALDEQTTSTHA